MPPDQDKPPSGGREEFEVAYYTKELGRPLQRQLLKQRLADFLGGRARGATPAEDASPQVQPLPAQNGSKD